MRSVYERENLTITEFDTEDVITTSGSDDPKGKAYEEENAIGDIGGFDGPGNWF